MTPDVIVNILILTCLLFWGTWGIFDKKALSVVRPEGQLVAVFCFCPILALMLIPALNLSVPGWHLDSRTITYVALGSLANSIATIAYLVAMSKKDASIIVGATASYPVVAQLLAFLILGEQLVMARLIGCSAVVLGIAAISCSGDTLKRLFEPKEKDASAYLTSKFEPHNDSFGSPEIKNSATATLEKTDLKVVSKISSAPNPAGTIAVIGTAVAICGWAVRGVFDKIAVTTANPLEVYFAKCVCDSVFCVGLLVWFLMYKRMDIGLTKPKLWPLAFGSAFAAAGGSAAYYMAMSLASASYVIAITGCYPLIMYMLALLILKERFNSFRLAGIVLITIGAIITQTTQGL